MKFLDRLKNIFPSNPNQYKTDSDAVIITA